MARSPNSHAASEPRVPAEIIKRHRADWHVFTRYIFKICVAVAVVLLLMLLFLRIL